MAPEGISYSDMNRLAAQAPVGSAGVSILPFGNGAERMLENKETGCSICGVNFNLHGKQHIVRAAQEGIVFSFKYGIDIMEQMGIPVQKIHAGHALSLIHISEPTRQAEISYAVFCLKKKKKNINKQ